MSYQGEAVHDGDCNDCVHYWLIDGKNAGVCKKCGASRQFPRSWSPLSIRNAWRYTSGKAGHPVPDKKS